MRLVHIIAIAVLGLSACGTEKPTTMSLTSQDIPAIYAARSDVGPSGEVIEIPAVRAAYLTDRNKRQRVPYNGPEKPGTIVVDPYARVLYDVMENGEAMRFGIAVGRAGKGFAGDATVQLKKQWPSWTPTQNMIRTEPDLYGQFAGGLPGGVDNPLGSRALYLYRGGRDTYYRIHGTMDPSSIGKATSAGCIRLFNQDIMDLFDETEIGNRVTVRTEAESVRYEGEMIETPEGYVVPANEMAQATGVAAPVDGTGIPQTNVSPVESAVPQ